MNEAARGGEGLERGSGPAQLLQLAALSSLLPLHRSTGLHSA
jgi:hypothetical protein